MRVFSLFLLMAIVTNGCTAETISTPSAVMALAQRVLGDEAAAVFSFTLVSAQTFKCTSPVGECVQVMAADNSTQSLAAPKIDISATSVPSLAYGLGKYLKETCNGSLTWVKTGGLDVPDQCKHASTLPLPKSTRRYDRALKWTYYQNVVDSSYSFVWWDIDRWQIEIDWMSLTGINIGLVYTGQEKVLNDLYQQFGVNLSEASGNTDFFNGPAFLSWSRGQGQAGVGGQDAFVKNHTGALPSWWLDQQAALGVNQALRMRELGIVTILRGFEGNVPGQIKQKFPAANISQVGATNWQLDALDPLFARLADAYMKLLIAEFGTDHYYQADGFFNNKRGPWAETQRTHSPLPSCQFASVPNSYIMNCAGGCAHYPTLAEAENACALLVTCGGVTEQYGSYQLRADHTTTPDPANKPANSWLITNYATCRPPAPPPPPPDADAYAHATAAYTGLNRTDPNAVWVYQTWIWRGFGESNVDYLRGWLAAIPHGKELFLDQTAEWTPIWSKFNNWNFLGRNFVWCTMSTMGGNVGMYGNMEVLNSGPIEALQANNKSMIGVGIDPEGIDTNPAYYHLLLDTAWRSTTINVSTYLASWADQRCGVAGVQDVRDAWAILGNTVYSNNDAQSYEHHMGYCPTSMPEGSGWDRQHASERATFYNTSDLHKAWELLVSAAPQCTNTESMIFDVVDVGREYLSVAPCNARYDALVAAKTKQDVVAANASLSELMSDLDQLLGSSNGFLLGQWVGDARALATNNEAAADADFMEWNARAQVTSWFPSDGCDGHSTSLDGLWDYGNKAWSGLVKGYYDQRFHIYADHKLQALALGETVLASSYVGDVVKLACEFAHSTQGLSPTAVGDAVALSKQLLQKYQPSL
eukprot:m.62506 g.62506  ORF g.62506 m.62506 type:complete len:871 (+) comp23167_c0_seq2:160-2772(+)